MRMIFMSLAATLAMGSAAAPAETPKSDGVSRSIAKAEAKLAEALKGRVAGKPVDCITQHEIQSSRIFDRTAILYEMRNGTYYLNRPKTGAGSLNWSNVLVTDTHSSQLCSIDIVRLYDSGTRMPTGFVGLDMFIPYAKPKPAPKGHEGHEGH